MTVVASRDAVLDTCVVGQKFHRRIETHASRFDLLDRVDDQADYRRGVMMLEEQHKVSLDAPVSDYLPEFKDLKDGEGKSVSVTLKQLLTHSRA